MNNSRSGNSDAKLLGRWGEAKAAEWMKCNGFILLAAGYYCRFGEIDLIAENEKYICFTEVKLRKSAKFAQAREFVDLRKQERLRQTAQLYLMEHPTPLQPRFDVVEIYAPDGMKSTNLQINYLENAF